MDVSIFYQKIGKVVGCKKVIDNLLAGFSKLGINVLHNTPSELTGCIHGGSPNFKVGGLPKKCLVGPEIMVLPTEMPWVWDEFKYYVQPCRWTVEVFQQFVITDNTMIFEWPVGIDSDSFNETKRGNFTHDCFVYYKDVTRQNPRNELTSILNQLKQRKLTHVLIEYGRYTEPQLVELTKKCKFGVFFTGTESQGIALMEVMSSNVPVFVFDQKTFLYSDFKFTAESVSSAPYFDDRCGKKTEERSLGSDFDEFLSKVDTYRPRDFILQNHTLEASAKEYYDILVEVSKIK